VPSAAASQHQQRERKACAAHRPPSRDYVRFCELNRSFIHCHILPKN
jgi:hypothetical protein